MLYCGYERISTNNILRATLLYELGVHNTAKRASRTAYDVTAPCRADAPLVDDSRIVIEERNKESMNEKNISF